MLKKILRGIFFCSKIEITGIAILFLIWTVLLTSCGEQPFQKDTITPVPEVIYTAYPSYMIGEIVNIDGCIRIRSMDNNKSSAVVWTPDTLATIDGDQVRIIQVLSEKI